MEQKSSAMLKSAMNSGIILAIISILFTVIVWVTNMMESMGLMASFVIAIISLLITVIMLTILTKRYRVNFLDNQITFKEAFFFGLLVVLLSTIIVSLYNYIFHNFIDPGYQERVMANMQDKLYQMMSSNGVPDDKIEEALSQMQEKGNPSPLEMLKQSVTFGLIGGSIMSLISSAIVKKNKNNDDAFSEAMEDVKSED